MIIFIKDSVYGRYYVTDELVNYKECPVIKDTPENYKRIINHLVDMAETLGQVMSDLGINSVEELYKEYEKTKGGIK